MTLKMIVHTTAPPPQTEPDPRLRVFELLGKLMGAADVALVYADRGNRFPESQRARLRAAVKEADDYLKSIRGESPTP